MLREEVSLDAWLGVLFPNDFRIRIVLISHGQRYGFDLIDLSLFPPIVPLLPLPLRFRGAARGDCRSHPMILWVWGTPVPQRK